MESNHLVKKKYNSVFWGSHDRKTRNYRKALEKKKAQQRQVWSNLKSWSQLLRHMSTDIVSAQRRSVAPKRNSRQAANDNSKEILKLLQGAKSVQGFILKVTSSICQVIVGEKKSNVRLTMPERIWYEDVWGKAFLKQLYNNGKTTMQVFYCHPTPLNGSQP